MNRCSISCDLHDYIEIACMYSYRVKLTLRNQLILEGKAIDTTTSADKREYLIIDNGHKQQIELTQLKNLKVLTPNARFTEICF